jgi:hypothetical protein
VAYQGTSRETTATPAAVWQVWSNVDTWPEWNPDMNQSHLDGPLRVGTTGKINTRSGGEHSVIVTQFQDGQLFELESTAMPFTKMAIRATVTPLASGSRVTQEFEARGFLAPLVTPMMSGTILKTFSQVLEGLTQRVERI